MMKSRFALASTALVLFGAAALGALSSHAEAQAVSGSVYYGPQPAYVAPQPAYVYPPVYYYPAPAYYYPPPPPPAPYYYPAPVYYEQPSYLVPGVSANFIFGFGGGRGHHGHHH
jgi:hypothetical protein